jgi:DNA-binding NarL/FixJ family response regulator
MSLTTSGKSETTVVGPSMPGKQRVLLGDDHLLILEGIAKLLDNDFEIVGCATDGQTLVAMAEQSRPNLVLLDISMPVMNGVEAIRRIHKALPDTKLIVITQHNDRQYMESAFRAGAHAYVLKQCATSELITALREVTLGHYYISPQLPGGPLLPPFDPSTNPESLFGTELTSRQREVVQLLAEGHSAKEIAHRLHISVKTVEFHKSGIMRHLGMRSSAELIRYAVETGMVRQ